MGSTPSRTSRPSSSSSASAQKPDTAADDDNDNDNDEGWQTVDRAGRRRQQQEDKREEKRQKKIQGSYPGLTYSEGKQQSIIKIGDLQGLVLYCLADGTAPQWVSVRHHAQIQKVVVLMVPGLELGMFDGSIPLGDIDDGSEGRDGIEKQDGAEVNGNANGGEADGDSWTRISTKKHLSPDDYCPKYMKEPSLPEPLRPLASIFPQIWPVQTPGDDRYNKVHSPLHAMLQSTLPRSKEEKKQKGPKPPAEEKNWQDQRTRITNFLASTEDLHDSEYTLHPAAFSTAEEKAVELQRRKDAHEAAEDGWVDTNVASIADGDVPEAEIQKGSLTAGREVLAMDCEMCITEGGGSELTRISLVGWDGRTVLDELVKPDRPIIDYLTPSEFPFFLKLHSSFHALRSFPFLSVPCPFYFTYHRSYLTSPHLLLP